jgi:NMD protein affecting ribosome stability and mRNA decay
VLKGFEDITCDLSDYEKTILVPEFVNRFKDRVGSHRAVSNSKIIKSLKSQGFKISDSVRVRKIINYIRNHKLTEGCLIANSKGYYISYKANEIKEYLESLEGREYEIRKTKLSVKEYLTHHNKGHQVQLNF